jgi:hypothetical protein
MSYHLYSRGTGPFGTRETDRMRDGMDLLESIRGHVSKADSGCLEWTGVLGKGGYGMLHVANRSRPRAGSVMRSVHRVVWEMLCGPIPHGLVIDHLCRNRRCVNPAHMEVVTPVENTLRGDVGKHWARRTHCKHGHEYTAENTRVVRGARVCRECQRISALSRWRRRRAEAENAHV